MFISQQKKSASAKNRRGSRKHLLGNIGEKIGKNRQTAASIKKCKFCTSIGSKFPSQFFPLFADFSRSFPIFSRFFPIFADFFLIFADFCRCLLIFRDVRFFEKIAIFSGRKIGSQKKSRFFGTSPKNRRFFLLWYGVKNSEIISRLFNNQ